MPPKAYSDTPTPSKEEQLLNAVTQNKRGVASTPTNTNVTDGSMDYTKRKSVIAGSAKKVSLVGRYGAGTTNIWGGPTAASSNRPTEFKSVIFNVTPQLSESGSLIAVDIGEIRSAGSVIVYLGSPARNFTINAKFVARTPEEAQENFEYISLLKAWRMPQSNQDEPETLRLFAYENSLRGIPCMMQNLNIEWSDDVDYIKASKSGVMVPIIQNVSIALKEIRNYDDIEAFDYEKFRAGKLDQW